MNLENSTYISDNNRSGFTGTFYATIDNSKVQVLNSHGNGSNGTYYTIKMDRKFCLMEAVPGEFPHGGLT